MQAKLNMIDDGEVQEAYSTTITSSGPVPEAAATGARELFSVNMLMIFCSGTSPGIFIHALSTVDARVDSSERFRRSFDTVRPPCENDRSASTDVAERRYSSAHVRGLGTMGDIPGVDSMSRAIRASGLRALSNECQCLIGSATLSSGGVFRYSSRASVLPEECASSRAAKRPP